MPCLLHVALYQSHQLGQLTKAPGKKIPNFVLLLQLDLCFKLPEGEKDTFFRLRTEKSA